MKKILILLVALLCTAALFSQNERTLKLDNDSDTIEVVFYHDNGVVSQTGAYTFDGKLQGEWLTYDNNGKKTASASYENGKKVGKWFFWNGTTLKEVDYTNNAIASINEWINTSSIALSN